MIKYILASFTSGLIFVSCQNNGPGYDSWPHYGGSPEMIRYSTLSSIDTLNVAQLKLAWSYSSGDVDTAAHSQIQCNPIVINGVLYGVSPQMKLFALDAATGEQQWIFDPNDPKHGAPKQGIGNVRGVSYWTDRKKDQRLFYTAGALTFAINAENGKPIPTFGTSGYIDLHNDLDRESGHLLVTATSPGMVYKDLLIMGTRLDEAPPAAPGHIRAYDVRTGKRKWIFHTIPHPGEYGYDTWEDKESWKHAGGANVWSGFSLDQKRGILFAPTGSAVYDFYGGKRKGANLFANCLLALDAATGKRLWHFQFMHHDVWDKDLPTPPALVTLRRKGKLIDAVAQPTKNGMVYVFERETGKPIFDIVEMAVDTVSELIGEQLWPTQPVPLRPPAFVRQKLTANDVNPYLPDSSKSAVRRQMAGFRWGGMFNPPGLKPVLVFPGFDGGAEWGGPAFDPQTGLLYVNANEMAWVLQMRENPFQSPPKETWLEAGKRLYARHCQSCHGADLKGTGNNPSLLQTGARFTADSLLQHINIGRRMMPGFAYLPEEDKKAIISFIADLKTEQKNVYTRKLNYADSIHWMPYHMMGYNKFLSPEGLPAFTPPFGTLNAIDLNEGSIRWSVPLGEYEEFKAKGAPPTGTENYGGPIVTKGGLVFIAAARDGKIRAFNKFSGKLLWEYTLPAPGFATPSLYRWKGKDYLVIACGGGKLGTKSSDRYLAFAL
jgi:quinoprotein glucose dehydrogenase